MCINLAPYYTEKYCSYSNRVVSLVADLFERDFILSFSVNNQADAIETFIYIKISNDFLNIDKSKCV